jgi:radical SAM protein with 4Fe4S-binding SPASM domain
MNGYAQNIGWVDRYLEKVRPFIYVRERDALLIKIPNQVYKLNPSALRLLQRLQAGASVVDIIGRYRDPEAVARDIHVFFCDLRAALQGDLREGQSRAGVEEIRFGLGYNTLPVLSEIALTYRCNLACRFCYAACGCHQEPNAPELDTAGMRRVLGIIHKEAEVPSVSFTGGEPTLRHDLPQLVAHAKSLDLWTNLISNGTLLTPDLVQGLKTAGLDSAQISIEGGQAEVHDEIVGRRGAFDRTLQGLEQLQHAGIRVHTNTTISRLNREHLVEVVELVHRLGLDRFSMNLLMPAGAALTRLDEILVSYRDIGPIILAVQSQARRRGLEFMWYSPTPMCIFNPVVHGLGNKGCAACDGLLSISPSGDILPCSSYPRPMGNLLQAEGRFQALWQSPHFAFFQQKQFAHAHCQACEHLAICNGGCPLYWQEVGYDEILAPNATEALL